MFRRLTLLSILIAIVICPIAPGLSADNTMPEIILTISELNIITEENLDAILIKLAHFWEHAAKQRMIYLDGSGDFVLFEFQDAQWIKEAILNGELSTQEFTPSELEEVMRQTVDYTTIMKGKIKESEIKAIISIIANGGDEICLQGRTSQEYPNETIALTISTGDESLVIIENEGTEYANDERLGVLHEVESYLLCVMECIDMEEIESSEYIEFTNKFHNPSISEAMLEESKLAGGGNYDSIDYTAPYK